MATAARLAASARPARVRLARTWATAAAASLVLLVLATSSATVACEGGGGSGAPASCPTPAATLAAVVPAWLAILEAAGNGPFLNSSARSGGGGLTLFAPTDAALARPGTVDAAWAPGVPGSPTAPPGSVAALLQSAPAAAAILIAGHAVRGTRRAGDLRADTDLTTLATRKLVGRRDEKLLLSLQGRRPPTPLVTSAGGVTGAVVGPDAGGGCGPVAVHVVDTVLLPFAPFKEGHGGGARRDGGD